MPKRTFTLRDCDKIINDILDEYFEQHNIDYDLKELMRTTMRSEETPGEEVINNGIANLNTT